MNKYTMDLEAIIERKDARIAELEAALRPFAAEAGEWKPEARDDEVPSITAHDGSGGDAMYCVGDLRRAAAAMAGGPTQAAAQATPVSGQEGLVHGGFVAGGCEGVPGE